MGLIMNGILKVPMQFFILLVGVMVFVFYQFEPAPLHFNPKAVAAVKSSEKAAQFNALETENLEIQQQIKSALLEGQSNTYVLYQLDKNQRKKAKKIIEEVAPNEESNDKDYVFITFILNHLPTGLIGLLLAVIFSAAMSSTASELNALAATTTVDLYQRNRRGKSPEHYVRASKSFTLLWGVVAILFAFVGNLFENLILLVNIIGSLFYGTILGIFLVAIFIDTIKAKAVFWAAVLSEACILVLFDQDLVSFLWLNVIGAVLTILFAFGFQKILNSKV
jgi:Na+(H+)/acetate symporter ActP